jgi:hypothetical protein
MKLNAAPTAQPTAFELWKLVETLAVDAHRSRDLELSFVLAVVSIAFGNGIVGDIGGILEGIIGSEARVVILQRLADAAARLNVGKN